MEIITKIFNMDFEALVPKLETLLGLLRPALTVCVFVGPLIMLVLGIIYLLIPPKEANYRFGFRTYFGMGSVDAWRFTQRIAGTAYTVLGLGLLVVIYLWFSRWDLSDPMQLIQETVVYLLLQLALALLARWMTGLLAAIFFTSYGDRRSGKRKNRKY